MRQTRIDRDARALPLEVREECPCSIRRPARQMQLHGSVSVLARPAQTCARLDSLLDGVQRRRAVPDRRRFVAGDEALESDQKTDDLFLAGLEAAAEPVSR